MKARTLPIAPLKYKPPFKTQEQALKWVEESTKVWKEWDNERRSAIHGAHEDVGCTFEQIAKATGLASSTVHRIVHEVRPATH